MSGSVRVRFAPSPTGALHVGGAHTALFNWLWARKHRGVFVLRIEDTDADRSSREYERTIFEGLRWLGLNWDEGPDVGGPFGPYRQSERLELYREVANSLLDRGLAYRDGEAVVFRVLPGERIAFDDLVYGRIEVESSTLKDLVLLKSDGTPTYNFAVVVDDHHMGITHVIRGEDHIANTPKQILLYRAMGWELPAFAHLGMILGPDRKKFSKRHGATAVFDYRDQGYLPEAMVNFLALLGWSPGDDREVLSVEEIIELFDLKDVLSRASIFDFKKLDHINQEHIKRANLERLLEEVKPFWDEMGLDHRGLDGGYLLRALELARPRARTLRELAQYTDYFVDGSRATLRAKEMGLTGRDLELLREYASFVSSLEEFTSSRLYEASQEFCASRGITLKDIAMPLRIALTGTRVSPGVFEMMELLGSEESLRRIERLLTRADA